MNLEMAILSAFRTVRTAWLTVGGARYILLQPKAHYRVVFYLFVARLGDRWPQSRDLPVLWCLGLTTWKGKHVEF